MNSNLLYRALLGATLAILPLQAEAKPRVGLRLVAEGFTSPTALIPLDDTSGRLLVADQVGVIKLLENDGKVRDTPFFDMRDHLTKLNQGFDERGLLGLALHPQFQSNGKLYVYYSAPKRIGAPDDWDHTSRLSEFKLLAGDSARVDPGSERVILEINQPYFNHNGGCITFGADGFLYIAVGDGGNANDEGIGHSPQGNGQDTTNLMGKILRIDVNNGNPYAIPADNPFADGNHGRPEIYAYGLRNPWRISFDRGGSHELFAADIGQTLLEEVDIIIKGGNYGWRIREGTICFDPKNVKNPPADCPKVGARGEPLIDPILEYKNLNGYRNDPEAFGISVTGGYVYRGEAIPELQGAYVFADWSRNWALPDGVLFVGTRPKPGEGPKWNMQPLPLAAPENGKVGSYVVAFGEDADGELYVLTNGINALIGQRGKVYKLVPM